MELPQLVRSICEAVAKAGGQAWLVGGVVRDHMMGIVSKDFDIEVHRLEAEDLAKVLRRIGSVNEIGRSFGVFKLVEDGVECDISIPRHDSQHGQAHNDIVVVGNPYMGIESAARRRDLTINAIALDPLTGKIEDPFDGARDIERGRLAAVDPKTFSEDPLRALRVVQFAARFGFSVHPDLAVLCREARLLSLPPERVWGELEKLLLRAPAPSMGWMLLHDLRIASKVLPDVADIPPEQVAAALDRAAERRCSVDGKGRKIILMLSVMLHNATPQQVEATLDHLSVFRLYGVPVRKRVLELTARWQRLTSPVDDSEIRRLADETEVLMLAEVAAAVSGGPGPLVNLDRAAHLGIATEPLPVLLKGRDLNALNVQPGPHMGEALRDVREAQISGDISDKAGAIIWLKDHLK
jgi:tRNA nucleotidyltransferase (CCA-adding enzyme)